MLTKDNLLWTKEEYQAVVDYAGNYYHAINVLLSKNTTERETKGNGKGKEFLPKTAEEFKKILETTVSLYSAIRKNYHITKQDKTKVLFRGTKAGKVDSSFLSTSENAKQALDFAKVIDKRNKGSAVLLALSASNVPYINMNSILPSDEIIEDETEILFLPCQIENFQEIGIEDCIDIAKSQGEQTVRVEVNKKNYGDIKFYKADLKELDYNAVKTDMTKEDLCNSFAEYRANIEKIRTMNEETPEYAETMKVILQFKRLCCNWVYQEFHQIQQSIDKSSQEEKRIHISENHEKKEVEIGNSGDMYQVSDKTDEKEYYFKPAISKYGSRKPYRAYIQEAAYDVQRIINPERAVKCNSIELDGELGAIQEKVAIDAEKTKAFIEYFNKGQGELSPKIIEQMMDEYLVDLCLCNYDSNAKNFIIDQDGNLRGIDKEQAFRYIHEDRDMDMTFSKNYNAKYGENFSVYAILFQKMKSGEIPDKYLEQLRYRASRIAQYPDEEYRKIFEKYAYGKAESTQEAEKLLESILARKSNILDKVESLCCKSDKIWDKVKSPTQMESQKRTTIPMKSFVSNAIAQGISKEQVANSDRIEQMQVKKVEGVTRDE